MAHLGIRVLRGPDWDAGNVDGGEGHLGTVKALLSNNRVHVLWDTGQESTCRAGDDGKRDLRVYDTAQAGVRHPNTKCAECGEVNIFGMIWRCKQCTECVLCSQCYNGDKHDIRHQFLRIDTYKSSGVEVKKRKISVRMRALGLFPGAKVARGHDWVWADQDGGVGSEGELLSFENVAPASSRNLVKVRWPNGRRNSYRLGFQGHVDLMCVEEEAGGFYYRDHLPALDAADLPYPLAPPELFSANTDRSPSTSADTGISTSSTPTSTGSSANTNTTGSSGLSSGASAQSSGACAAEVETDSWREAQAVGGVDSTGEELSVAVGDKVAIAVDENSLRDLQENFGGCTDYMISFIGHEGDVMEVKGDGKIMVRLKTKIYGFNPAALVKVTSFSVGDEVRIRGDVNQVKVLMRTVGRQTDVPATCGRVGRVTAVGDTGELTVSLGGGQQYVLPPACCLIEPRAGPDTAVTQDKVRDEKKLTDAGAGKAKDTDAGKAKDAVTGKSKDDPAAYWNERYNNNQAEAEVEDKSDSDSDTDVTKALMRMLGGRMGRGSNSDESKDPKVRRLFKAIESDDVETVSDIVTSDRGKLTSIHKAMTPLMYASYIGRRKIVTSLLDLGADINGRGDKGRTPLLVAIDGNEEDIALLLLDRGAKPGVQNHHQRTPLHAAALANMTQVAQILVCMDVDVNAKDFVQDTPLFDAINKGNDAVVQILIQSPLLNRYQLNGKGFNMLQQAALRGNQKIVEMILTCEEGYPDVDDLLLGEWSALHIAANNDHVESLGYLVLLGGATVNMPDGRRHLTPLHLACKRRHIRSSEALIGLGANVNMHDVDGNTPLHLAIGKKLEEDDDDKGVPESIVVEQRVNLARLLIANGADVYSPDVTGKTALEYGLQEVRNQVLLFLTHSGDGVKSSQEVAGPTWTELDVATSDSVPQPDEAEEQSALDILNHSDADDQVTHHDAKVLDSFNVPQYKALNTYEDIDTTEKTDDDCEGPAAYEGPDITEKTFDSYEGADTTEKTIYSYEDIDTTEKTLDSYELPDDTEETLGALNFPVLTDQPVAALSDLDMTDDLHTLLGAAEDEAHVGFFQAYNRPAMAEKPVDPLVLPGTVADCPDSALSLDTADQPLSTAKAHQPISLDTADQPFIPATADQPLSLDTADQSLNPDKADQPQSTTTADQPLSLDTVHQPLSLGTDDQFFSAAAHFDVATLGTADETADQSAADSQAGVDVTSSLDDAHVVETKPAAVADDTPSRDDAAVVETPRTQCARCDAVPDVMLLPCRHKSVCRRCCDSINECPLCHKEVEERFPDNTDDQGDEEEEMNQFD